MRIDSRADSDAPEPELQRSFELQTGRRASAPGGGIRARRATPRRRRPKPGAQGRFRGTLGDRPERRHADRRRWQSVLRPQGHPEQPQRRIRRALQAGQARHERHRAGGRGQRDPDRGHEIRLPEQDHRQASGPGHQDTGPGPPLRLGRAQEHVRGHHDPGAERRQRERVPRAVLPAPGLEGPGKGHGVRGGKLDGGYRKHARVQDHGRAARRRDRQHLQGPEEQGGREAATTHRRGNIAERELLRCCCC